MQALPSIRRVLLTLVLSSVVPMLLLAGGVVLLAYDRSGAAAFDDPRLQLLLVGTLVLAAPTLWVAWRAASSITVALDGLSAAVRAAGEAHALQLPPARFEEEQQLGQALIYANTALRDSHEALRAKEARFRMVLDTARDAIVTADEDGRIVLFNRAAEHLFGVAEDAAIGCSLEMFLPPEHRPGHLGRMRAMRTHPPAPRLMGPAKVVRAMRADGTRFPVSAAISVAIDGERRLYTAILREVDTAFDPESTVRLAEPA